MENRKDQSISKPSGYTINQQAKEIEESIELYKPATEKSSIVSDEQAKRIIDLKAEGNSLMRTKEVEGVTEAAVQKTLQLAKFNDVHSLLKGMGIGFGQVTSLAIKNLLERLALEPDSFSRVELSGIASYSATRSQALLSMATPEQPPEWGKLAEDLDDGVNTQSKSQ